MTTSDYICRIVEGRQGSHCSVAARGVEDVVPLLLGQLSVPVLVSLVEHLLDLKTMTVVEVKDICGIVE